MMTHNYITVSLVLQKIKVSDIKDLLSKNEEDLQKRIEEITVKLFASTLVPDDCIARACLVYRCPGSASDPQLDTA